MTTGTIDLEALFDGSISTDQYHPATTGRHRNLQR
jgi:hypothetical protein